MKYTLKIHFDMWSQKNVWERDFENLKDTSIFLAETFDKLHGYFPIHRSDLSNYEYHFDKISIPYEDINKIKIKRSEGEVRQETKPVNVPEQILTKKVEE